MADFADFIAYLADRHRLSGGGFLAKQRQRKATTSPSSSGNGAGGGFAGYIIWNEAASALWFDTSPFIAPASGGALRDQSQAERWADAYAALLEAAERSLRAVGARPALVLASLDTLWASPGEKGPIYSPGGGAGSNSSSPLVFPLGGVHAGRAHLGSGNLVEALWRRLGTRVDWSLVRFFSFSFSFLFFFLFLPLFLSFVFFSLLTRSKFLLHLVLSPSSRKSRSVRA